MYYVLVLLLFSNHTKVVTFGLIAGGPLEEFSVAVAHVVHTMISTAALSDNLQVCSLIV